jgi:hypothetical protein
MVSTDSGPSNPLAEYARTQIPALGDICERLQAETDRALPNATSRIWHGAPVWFIGENPVVGYRVQAKRVDLMFWSGQLFDESLLKAVGKDKAAQISIRDGSEINLAELSRWLTKARTVIFDYAGMYARKRGTRPTLPDSR